MTWTVRFCGLLLAALVMPTCAGAQPAGSVPPLYRNASVFSAAIERAEQAPLRSRQISGITVPHHLLAADLIARTFRMVQGQGVDKVVLLFPDHFKRSRLPFATTRRDFQTVFGPIATRRADVSRLLELSGLVEESTLFDQDHGIGAVLPFVKHFLPDADIVPIAVSITSRRAQWDALTEQLRSIVGPRTLIVQSTDFSHYLPFDAAVQRDQEVLNVLAAGDLDALAELRQPDHLDSRGSQYVQTRLQRQHFNARPRVLFNLNSQSHADAPVQQTTSYIVQVYEPAQAHSVGAKEEGSRVYCFAGDTFFGRGLLPGLVNPAAAARVLAEMQSLLGGCPLVVNLEGVVLPELPSNAGPDILAMPASVAIDWLRALNVVAVSLANNHAMDLGAPGLEATAGLIRAAGIKVIRHGDIVDLGPLRVAALTDLDNHRGLRSGAITGDDMGQLARSNARPPVVAFVHWGTEYDPKPGAREQALTLDLLRGGVSLIVGAHPHVASTTLDSLQSGQALRAFSLGNFIFDQSRRHASGAVLELRMFEQGTFFTRLVPIPNFYDRLREEESRTRR